MISNRYCCYNTCETVELISHVYVTCEVQADVRPLCQSHERHVTQNGYYPYMAYLRHIRFVINCVDADIHNAVSLNILKCDIVVLKTESVCFG